MAKKLLFSTINGITFVPYIYLEIWWAFVYMQFEFYCIIHVIVEKQLSYGYLCIDR